MGAGTRSAASTYYGLTNRPTVGRTGGRAERLSATIRFLGVSGFELVTREGTKLLVDPLLAGRPEAGIDPSPVALEELADADLILVTHGAWDHLGQAFELLRGGAAQLVCGPEVEAHALANGVSADRVVKIIEGCRIRRGAVLVTALRAHHLSLFETGSGWISGPALSFLIESADGTRVFHSGDTALFGDLRLFGELYSPDVALLCVGATEPELAPLPPEEAALAADWLDARVVIPMHFVPGSPAPQQFARHLAGRRSDIEVVHLSPGEVYARG